MSNSESIDDDASHDLENLTRPEISMYLKHEPQIRRLRLILRHQPHLLRSFIQHYNMMIADVFLYHRNDLIFGTRSQSNSDLAQSFEATDDVVSTREPSLSVIDSNYIPRVGLIVSAVREMDLHIRRESSRLHMFNVDNDQNSEESLLVSSFDRNNEAQLNSPNGNNESVEAATNANNDESLANHTLSDGDNEYVEMPTTASISILQFPTIEELDKELHGIPNTIFYYNLFGEECADLLSQSRSSTVAVVGDANENVSYNSSLNETTRASVDAEPNAAE